MAQDDFSDSAMIALLPIQTEWCKQPLPHVTLVYAGLVSDHKPGDFNELAKDAASIAMITDTLLVKVTGTDVFGDPPDEVDVLTLEPTPQLLSLRRFVEQWNASEHDFSPHATIGPVGSSAALVGADMVPMYLTFDRIMVGWGKDNLTFWLKR